MSCLVNIKPKNLVWLLQLLRNRRILFYDKTKESYLVYLKPKGPCLVVISVFITILWA